MTFDQLKEIHLYNLEVVLLSGRTIKGSIVSHQFVPGSYQYIDQITILGSGFPERINTSDIKEFILLGKVLPIQKKGGL